MALRTGELTLLIVAGPTRRRMSLAPRGAYLDYVCAHLAVRHVDTLMATVAACGSRMAAVLEIIEAQRGQRSFSKFQRCFGVGMADAALAQFLCRLMRVTAITLLMAGEGRANAVGELMASATISRYTLAFHLLRVHVVFVRKTLQSELAHLGRKTNPRPLHIDGACVTDYAHLARGVSKIFRVTSDAGVMAWKDRSHAVIGALMAKAAILCLGLMFGPVMIERRFALDYD